MGGAGPCPHGSHAGRNAELPTVYSAVPLLCACLDAPRVEHDTLDQHLALPRRNPDTQCYRSLRTCLAPASPLHCTCRYAGGSVHSFLKHLFSALAPPNGLPSPPGALGDHQRSSLQQLLQPRAPGMLRSLAAGTVGALPSYALDQICGAFFAILQVSCEALLAEPGPRDC